MILDQMAKLSKRDILKIQGDFIFDGPNYDYYITQLKKMSCRIQVLMGNHDSLRLYKEDCIEMQLPFFSYKNHWLSHCPIHPQEMRNRQGNIHGHLHGDSVMRAHYNIESDVNDKYLSDKRYFNVCLDNNNNRFVPFDLIREVLKD